MSDASAPDAPPRFRRLFELLRAHVDAGTWWPGESRFEIIVGAILVQNTAWTNAERAIAQLREVGALDPSALLALERGELHALVRPAGFATAKARYLQAVAAWFLDHDADAHALPTAELRRELLSVRGVGEETADVLCLYVYDRPVFIWDAYARRVLAAVGLGEYRSYGAARRALGAEADAAGLSAAEHGLLHGLIVETGKLMRRGEAPFLGAVDSAARRAHYRP